MRLTCALSEKDRLQPLLSPMEVLLLQSVGSENKALQTTCLLIVVPAGTVMPVKLSLDNFLVWKNTITPILNGYDLISFIENDPHQSEGWKCSCYEQSHFQILAEN